jgi:putative transposase
MKYRKQQHGVYYCQYHLVLVSQYRRKSFTAGIQAYMSDRWREIRQYDPEIEFGEIQHDEEHLQMLGVSPPKLAVGKAVGIIKANTSKRWKEQLPFLRKVDWGTAGIWSDGYCVSPVGVNEAVIQRYIEHQGQEDSGQAQLELW